MKSIARICIAAILVCAFALTAKAQTRMTITVLHEEVVDREKNIKEEVPIGQGCIIYMFETKKSADIAYEKLSNKENQGDILIKEDDHFKEEWVTDLDGTVENIATNSWYCFAYYTGSGVAISKEVVGVSSEVVFHMKNVTETIDQVDVVEKDKRKRKIKKRSLNIGDCFDFSVEYPISHDMLDAKNRYGVFPYFTESSNSDAFTSEYQKNSFGTNKVLKKCRPYIIDGEKYNATQYRRKGYNFANDSLFEFIDSTQHVKGLKDTVEYTFKIHEALKPASKEKIYPTYALRWYENYTGLLLRDTILVHNGYRTFPMRFLDFDLPDIDIHKENYPRRPKREPLEDNIELHLEFLSGEAEVSPTDTVNLRELDNIISRIKEIADDPDGMVFNVSIHGYASPDGGRTINEGLSRKRSDYLRNIVLKSVSTSISTKSTVTTWQDLANVMFEDSLKDASIIEKANEVQQIVNNNPEAYQESKIRALPYYKELIEPIYIKKLRKVEISYTYTITKELSPREVAERYENDPEFRKGNKLIYDYQFGYLFDYLKNRPDELEAIAKLAIEKCQKERTGKVWPIAAYTLAKCYAMKGKCDEKLLDPYIVTDDRVVKKKNPNHSVWKNEGELLNAEIRDMNGYTVEYINDEGIVLMQINMLLKVDKLSQAFMYSDNLLPDTPKFRNFKNIMECLTGNWNIPQVREDVAKTSLWNKIVVYAAQDSGNEAVDKEFWTKAYLLLVDSTSLSNPRELYMQAVLGKRLFDSAKPFADEDNQRNIPEKFFYFENPNRKPNRKLFNDAISGVSYPWGAAMIECCEKDESFINILKYDGEFSQSYRDAFAKYWNQIHPEKELR